MICGLSRASFKDIDRCAEAIKPAKRNRIHTFLSTSPVHMKYKLQKEPHEVYEMVIAQVTRARSHTDDVEWSAEDGTRSEMDYLCRIVEAVIKAGATTVNIPDTVGYTVPEEYFALFKMLRERVPNSDKAVFSVHCHNDLGMAVANSLAGVKAGCRQIECCINGIGERAGNTALEEVVMAMSVRNFERVFTREVGRTPSQYVLQARVEAARRQLERTDRGLKQVASAAGFGSADVMRRAFVRLLGITPRRYREVAADTSLEARLSCLASTPTW